jgi:hypothetical protein
MLQYLLKLLPKCDILIADFTFALADGVTFARERADSVVVAPSTLFNDHSLVWPSLLTSGPYFGRQSAPISSRRCQTLA